MSVAELARRVAAAGTVSGRSRLPALAILASVVLLALLLALSTVGYLDREQKMTERFLQEEGLTVIGSFEAGVRAALENNRLETSTLGTLAREIARAKQVAFVRVSGPSGRKLAEAGPEAGRLGGPSEARVLASAAPTTDLRRSPNGWVFEVARELRPVEATGTDPRLRTMRRRWQQWCDMGSDDSSMASMMADGSMASMMSRGSMGSMMGGRGPGGPGRQRGRGGAPDAAVGKAYRPVIAVGLYTDQFDAARRQDVRNSLLLGGTLLLVGGAGFYLLFLSQRNRVARATIESMRLYTRDVIESLPDALVTLDPGGRVVSVNDRARELFGLGDRDPAGAPLRELARSDACPIEPLLRAGEEFRDRPVECARPDGGVLPVQVSAANLTDRDGSRVGTILVIRDMRELRAVEEQLERSRRLASLGHLAAGIAHEIRNPLGTLRGFAQYFGSKNAGDPTTGEYAQLMVGEIDRLNRIITGLLQFARPREPEPQELSVASLAGKIEKLVADDVKAGGLGFRTELPPGDMVLQADPDLLTQVLLNLVHNAIAATERGGEVCLGAAADGTEVRITVDDTGRGLTAEERERMFDPFYTTRKTGTGLGLAVVHQIIEQHGGRIEVESILGRGTRVSLLFPRAPEVMA